MAERDRLEREKQARIEAEQRQLELEDRLRQMEDEVRKAIHARMQTEETLKLMQEQVSVFALFLGYDKQKSNIAYLFKLRTHNVFYNIYRLLLVLP